MVLTINEFVILIVFLVLYWIILKTHSNAKHKKHVLVALFMVEDTY